MHVFSSSCSGSPTSNPHPQPPSAHLPVYVLFNVASALSDVEALQQRCKRSENSHSWRSMCLSPNLFSLSLGGAMGPPAFHIASNISWRELLQGLETSGKGARGRSFMTLQQLPCSVLISSWKSCLVFFFMIDSQAPISAEMTKNSPSWFHKENL